MVRNNRKYWRWMIGWMIVLLLVAGIPFQALAQEGQWVLMETRYRVGGVSDEWVENPQFPMQDGNDVGSVRGEEGSGVLNSHLRSDSSVSLDSRWSWSEPPQVIRPGQTVRFDVDVEILGNTASDYGMHHSIYIHSIRTGATGDFEVVEPAGIERPSHLTYHANGTGNVTGSGSFAVARSFEDGWGSGVTEIDVRVTTGAAPNVYYVKYIYEWQESAAPEPAPTPEPVPTPLPEPAPAATGGSEQIDTLDYGNRMEWPTVRGALGYRIFRSTNPGELGISVTDFFVTALPFVDVNIEPNTDYYYTVKPVMREANPLQGIEEELGDPIATYTVRSSSSVISSAHQQNFVVLQIDNPYMSANGARAEIDPGRGTTPTIISNRSMVPIRAIVEAMGGAVGWDGAESKITLNAKGNNVEMWLNSNSIRANGVSGSMDVAPVSVGGRTFVPVRFSADNLDAEAHWINSTREVVIVY